VRLKFTIERPIRRDELAPTIHGTHLASTDALAVIVVSGNDLETSKGSVRENIHHAGKT
jgi:hypothetical protein